MDQHTLRTPASHRNQWLALLNEHGVGHPKSLQVMDVPGALVQATIGEPPGRISLEAARGNLLMFNMSPVQMLRQTRDGRFSVSVMLHGELTLLLGLFPSQWS